MIVLLSGRIDRAAVQYSGAARLRSGAVAGIIGRQTRQGDAITDLAGEDLISGGVNLEVLLSGRRTVYCASEADVFATHAGGPDVGHQNSCVAITLRAAGRHVGSQVG